METGAEKKFSRELRSFSSLAVINIAFSGIAMALGIAVAVTNIQALLSGWTAFNAAASVVGLAAFALAIRWLLAVTELFDGLDDIRDEYSRLKLGGDQQALAGLIARLAAHYRSNRQLISRVVLLTRVAGSCFLANGAFILLQAALSAPADWAGALGAVAASAVNFGVGAAGISIPHFFKRYSSCWESRLQGIAQAEEELEGLLGGR